MIFKSLLERFKPKTKIKEPLHGMDKTEQAELQSLTTHPGWSTYLKLLDNFIEHNARAMLNASNDADVHCFRGLIQGLELGPILVDSILKKEDTEHERERQRLRLSEQRARSDASLYGTSHWFDQRSG